MLSYSFFNYLLLPYHQFFTWRDGVEIIFFAGIVYTFSLWLKKDLHKNLLGFFYGYCGCFFIAQSLQLPTIVHLLFYASPVIIMLFIIFHQFTLQKNFVALRAIVHQKIDHQNWLDVIIQRSLIAINNNKEIIYVIENTDSLRDYLTCPLALHATITKELLTLLTDSHSFNQHQMIWLNAQGKILGINAQWNAFMHEQSMDKSEENIHQWHYDAIFYTEKMNALVFKINPSNHLFDIVVRGKTYKQLTAPHARTFIKQYLAPLSSIIQKRKLPYAQFPHFTQKHSHSEHNH